MTLEQLFHNIDKRLAVIEALSEAHTIETSRQLDELKLDVIKIRDEVGKLKVRVAGISASVSLVIGIVLKFWGGA
jgi:hypothetical protein